MQNCIYLFAGGQGQAILLLKPAVLSQPGLGRGDTGRGGTPTPTIKHGVTRPIGHKHVVGSCGTQCGIWSGYSGFVSEVKLNAAVVFLVSHNSFFVR